MKQKKKNEKITRTAKFIWKKVLTPRKWKENRRPLKTKSSRHEKKRKYKSVYRKGKQTETVIQMGGSKIKKIKSIKAPTLQ